MILHVTEVKVVGPHSLYLAFNDGIKKRVNLLPLLDGPVFIPLRNPALFASVELDTRMGTIVWPNEADIAPEALHDLPEEKE